MDALALIPIMTFVIPYLGARQLVSSAIVRLSDRERLLLFPLNRARVRLTWLAVPIVIALYLSQSVEGLIVTIGVAIIFVMGFEIRQLWAVRKLDLSPEFKRTQAIATTIACAGLLAAGAAFYVAQIVQ